MDQRSRKARLQRRRSRPRSHHKPPRQRHLIPDRHRPERLSQRVEPGVLHTHAQLMPKRVIPRQECCVRPHPAVDLVVHPQLNGRRCVGKTVSEAIRIQPVQLAYAVAAGVITQQLQQIHVAREQVRSEITQVHRRIARFGQLVRHRHVHSRVVVDDPHRRVIGHPALFSQRKPPQPRVRDPVAIGVRGQHRVTADLKRRISPHAAVGRGDQ